MKRPFRVFFGLEGGLLSKSRFIGVVGVDVGIGIILILLAKNSLPRENTSTPQQPVVSVSFFSIGTNVVSKNNLLGCPGIFFFIL